MNSEPAQLASQSMHGQLTVPGQPEQVAAARQFVANVLGSRHPCAETAVLLVSELVTNSIQHSASSRDGGTITITVTVTPATITRIEVTDDGAATSPVVRAACGQEETGRGMVLVEALASCWSSRRQGNRTVTWFELAPAQEQYVHEREINRTSALRRSVAAAVFPGGTHPHGGGGPRDAT